MPENQQELKFPYDRIYFVGDSLMSTQETNIEIEVFLAGTISSFTKISVPNNLAYYNKRFSDKDGFSDHFVKFIPEFNKPHLVYNYAYPGAGSFNNYLNLVSEEFMLRGINESSLGWAITSSSYRGNHISVQNQFHQIVAEERFISKKCDERGRPLVFIWGAGAHNDFMGLTYLAGYGHGWTTMPSITEAELPHLKETLNQVANYSAVTLQAKITELYNEGVRDFVVVDAMPIHITPYFTDLKAQYKDVKGFSTFVDNMHVVYNQYMEGSIEFLKQYSNDASFNLIHIRCQDLVLPADMQPISFINVVGNRHGKPYILANATEEEKTILSNSYFYDHIHLTSKGYEFIAGFLTEQLKKKDPKLKEYYAQKLALSKPENSSYKPQDKHLFVIAQNSSTKIFR